MKPHWINNIFIGPFWMGSAQEVQKTQEAIDEECALYEEASTSEAASTHDEPTFTEIGETHYDRQ